MPLVIEDLRGGFNDAETPGDVRPNQAVLCENIDLDRATCGGKRLGTSHKSNGYAVATTRATFLFRHTPTNDETETELWAAGPNASGTGLIAFRDASGWNTSVSFGPDSLIAASGLYDMEAQSLHGKLFLAYPAESGGSPVDRLHVRETTGGVTTFRRAGLAAPAAAPTGADTGSGTYASTRYVRVRFVTQVSGATVRRSEPSDVLTFAPSGSGSGLVVTRPALRNEGETHWEVELSLDNRLFYRVSTVAVGTTTYTDTVAATTGYAASGTLSEDIGDYTLLWSPKFLAADEDRLLIAGSWVNPDYASRVGWTPVARATGVGNDERLESDTDPFLDLDGYDGGELTAFEGPINGYLFAFKQSHIYKLARSGQRSQAYVAVPITKSVGAMKRSVVSAFDEYGSPCLYFADAQRGPQRIGARGLEDLAEDIRDTWRRVNRDATVPCHAVFYPDKRQVWFWVALDGATIPSHKLVLHVKYVRRTAEGVVGGWAVHDGPSAAAVSSCLYADNLDEVPSGTQSLSLKPYVGLVASGQAQIQQADTGATDNGTTYRGRIRTKAFQLGTLLQRAGISAGAVMCETESGSALAVSLIRDFGKETITKAISLTALAGEGTRIIRELDSLSVSDLLSLQIEIGDSGATANTWAIDSIALQTRVEERS